MNSAKEIGDYFRKEDTQRDIMNQWEGIKDDYGIELTVSEELILAGYTRCFGYGFNEARLYFMIKFFGLNELFLTKSPKNFLGDSRFIEYCRRNANEWRRERELI